MKKGIILLICVLFYCFAKGDENKPTIPLHKKIKVKITSIDSTTLGTYIIYAFKYKDKNIVRKAEFLALPNERIFSLGKNKLEFCKATFVNTAGLIPRSCYSFNRLYITKDDTTIVRQFFWSEFSEYPTLRYCKTGKH